ncbi:MAG: sulfite exporter TauE/SafE family protein [Deltaproteobacteria bacterium]|nr:sulfite exporter TauE/SafE family protein [Deltaproteobacteria bacterium]
MWPTIIAGGFIFAVSVLMTMVGKGGGNFYVLILAMSGIPIHQAATTGQFILFSAAVAAMVVFHKNKSVSWPLVLLIGGSTALSALAGGYFSHLFSGFSLKLIFAVMLFVSGAAMLIPVSEGKKAPGERKVGVVTVKVGDTRIGVNMLVALPVTLLAGFAAGMVGVSGGSFLVPLMVLACAVPMRVAVGTASALVAGTALMGFAGHAARGDFQPEVAVPLAVVTIVGGLLGGRFALKTKPKSLKKLFAYTNWLAAVFMVYNALHSANLM